MKTGNCKNTEKCKLFCHPKLCKKNYEGNPCVSKNCKFYHKKSYSDGNTLNTFNGGFQDALKPLHPPPLHPYPPPSPPFSYPPPPIHHQPAQPAHLQSQEMRQILGLIANIQQELKVLSDQNKHQNPVIYQGGSNHVGWRA